MIKLKDILYESKQVGVIYHYTSLQGLFDIMEDNRLNVGTYEKNNSISFTRDKFFGNRLRAGVKTDVRIVIDGSKLSNKYKIGPYQFTGSEKIKLGMDDDNIEWEQSVGDEQEERLFLPKGSRGIENVSDYILKIEFPKDFSTLMRLLSNITPFQTTGWSTKPLYMSLNSIMKKGLKKDGLQNSEYLKINRPAVDWWQTREWTTKDILRLAFLYYDKNLFDESKVKSNLPLMEQELSKYFGKPVTFTMEN